MKHQYTMTLHKKYYRDFLPINRTCEEDNSHFPTYKDFNLLLNAITSELLAISIKSCNEKTPVSFVTCCKYEHHLIHDITYGFIDIPVLIIPFHADNSTESMLYSLYKEIEGRMNQGAGIVRDDGKVIAENWYIGYGGDHLTPHA